VTSVEVRRPSLDDVFLTLTGRTLRDAEQDEPAAAEPVTAGAAQ
jgi:ABC-2 type transport system ATP-binding protein